MMAILEMASGTGKQRGASSFPTVIHVRLEEHDTSGRYSDHAHAITVDLVSRVLDRSPNGLGVVHAIPSRRPLLSGLREDENCTVSVSHAAGLVAVAASSGGAIVGIDVVHIADAASSLAWCIRKEELPNDEQGDAFRSRARVWAAKEAAFKASFVDEPFRPRRVSIAPGSERSFAWRRLTDKGWEGGAGVWLNHDRHMVAVAAQGIERDEITIVDHGRAETLNCKGFALHKWKLTELRQSR
jgi:hypothetical protein